VLSRSCRKKATMRWRWRRVIRLVVGTQRFTTAGRSGRLAAGSRTSGRSNEDHATVDHWVPHEWRARLDLNQMNWRTYARNMVTAAESAGLFFFQSAAPRRLIFALLSSMRLLRRILTEHRRNPSNIGTASDTIFDEMTLSIRS
jgi:hypothetical protein